MLAIENFGSKMSFIAAFFFNEILLNLMLGMGNAGCFRKINCKTWDQRNFSQIQMTPSLNCIYTVSAFPNAKLGKSIQKRNIQGIQMCETYVFFQTQLSVWSIMHSVPFPSLFSERKCANQAIVSRRLFRELVACLLSAQRSPIFDKEL